MDTISTEAITGYEYENGHRLIVAATSSTDPCGAGVTIALTDGRESMAVWLSPEEAVKCGSEIIQMQRKARR